MTNLTVLSTATVLTMSSREIAELTGKRHDHVIVDIRKMLDGLGLHSPDFSGQYIDSTGRSLPCFLLPKRETMVMQYDHPTVMQSFDDAFMDAVEAEEASEPRINPVREWGTYNARAL